METWKSCCPAARLKHNCCCCCWWNPVGWRITAVREKRLHHIWQLAWLSAPPSSPLHSFPLRYCKAKICVIWTFFFFFLKLRGKYHLFAVQQEILLFVLSRCRTKLNHIARSCFSFPLQSDCIFSPLLKFQLDYGEQRDVFTAAPWQL